MAKGNGANGGGSQTATEGKKGKYESMIVGVPAARKPLKASLDALSAKLGCKNSDLVWAGVEIILKNPPATAPAGSSKSTASAAGFWVQIPKGKDGKGTSVRVVEVESRSELTDAEGARLFIRYDRGDVKSRGRSRGQAIRAAQADAGLIGLKYDGKVYNTDGKEVKEPEAKAA